MKRILLPSKKSSLSETEAIRHWLDVHAPIVVGAPHYGRYMERYVQNPPIASLSGHHAFPYIGIAQFWVKPPPQDLPPLAETDYFRTKVIPDVDRFLEKSATASAMVDEHVIQPMQGSIRVLRLLRGIPDSATAYLKALQESAANSPAWSKVRGYTLNTVLPGTLKTYAGQELAPALQFQGIEEWAFDTEQDARDIPSDIGKAIGTERFGIAAAAPADVLFAHQVVAFPR